MTKKLLALGPDGRIVLRLPGGQIQPLQERQHAYTYLLIDCSSSMLGNKILQAKEGALAFAKDALNKGYSAGLIRFASTAEVLCSPREGLSVLESKLHRLEPSGGTNMTDAIELATRELASLSGVRVIVVATDGSPDSVASSLETAQRAKSVGIDIIAIGTDDADQVFLARLATRSELSVKVASQDLKRGISEAVRFLPGTTSRKN